MSRLIKLSLVLSCASLAACQTTMEEPTEKFGSAVRQNIAAQAVEPTPEQKQNTYIRPDSQRMAQARERYRKDLVEKPADQRISAED